MSDSPRLRRDLRARAAYAEGAGIYRIVPQAVAVPETTVELVDLIRWAARNRVPVVPRGAGSGMPGGNVGRGVVVDLTMLDGAPLAITTEGRAHAGTAVTWAAIEAAARPRGLRILPDPSSGAWATVGGLVATNAAGPRSLRYGPVRPWVEAVTVVTAEGHLTEFRRGVQPERRVPAVRRFMDRVHDRVRNEHGLILARRPPVAKNVSGYALAEYLDSGDLVDLIIGSEGTLGLITGVEWRLAPLPAAHGSLRVVLRGREDLDVVVAALRRHGAVTAELLDATFLQFVADAGGTGALGVPAEAAAVVLAEFEGVEAAAVEAQAGAAVAELTSVALALHQSRDQASEAELWAIRHAASPILAALGDERRSLQVIEDACVPLPRLAEYLARVEAVCRQRGIPAVAFGHAGDGNVHVNLLPDVGRTGWEDEVRAIHEAVSGEVIRMGGVLTGEHGDGRLRAPWLEATWGPLLVMLFRAVKEAFDPLGVLNPGIKLPDGTAGIHELKVGSGAVALPRDIAAGLRRIERERGYAQPRLELADGPPGERTG